MRTAPITRLGLALLLLSAAGCVSPGDYNLNVNVGTPTAAPTAPAGTPAAAASTGTPNPFATPTPIVASLAPTAPGSLGHEDQVQEGVSAFVQVGNGSRVAQTFTPKLSGRLAAIELHLKGTGASSDLALVIRTVDDQGRPADAIGAGTVAAAALTADGKEWTVAHLDVPAVLTAGTRYAWALTYTGASEVYVGADNDTTYANGTAFSGLTDGSTFWNRTGQDLSFRTYMQ